MAGILESLGLSEEDIAQNHQYRERFERDALESFDAELEEAAPADGAAAEKIGKLISQAAHELLFSFEVGGRSGYERLYKRPCKPGLSSGVTIGLGYDIGQNSAAGFERTWKGLIPDADFLALGKAVGRIGSAAAAVMPSVKDIVIPWDTAFAVYLADTVPRFGGFVLKIFPNAAELHPHAFGALFSLVYNRGPRMSGDKRIEMRAIRDHLAARRFELVPQEFQRMKRIWAGTGQGGLLKRRDAEGKLFEEGVIEANRAKELAAAAIAAASGAAGGGMGTATAAAAAPIPAPGGGAPAASPESAQFESAGSGRPSPTEEGDGAAWAAEDLESSPSQPSYDLEAPSPWDAVKWAGNDDDSTEYRHILAGDRALKGVDFNLTAADLELLIAANRFDPIRTGDRIVFGLRGATLKADTSAPDERFSQVDRQALRLTEARPNHENFRCVIGVYNLTTQRLSGFIANTVPNRRAIWGFTQGRMPSNMLPCGCYRYVVGAHSGGKYLGCLREDEAFAVLRTPKNAVFDVKDKWDPGFPMDNIHPAFGDQSAEFSSWGCQTIRGRGTAGTTNYTQEFAKFRAAMGFGPGSGDHGKNFSYMLLTGLEAAIAVRLREQGKSGDAAVVRASLGRLRQGSRGEEVKLMQAALGAAAPDGAFTAATKVALAERQTKDLGWADGIYSPAMDETLKINLLRPTPADAAVAAAPPPPQASPGAPPPPHPLAAAVTESVGTAGNETLEGLYYELGRRALAAEESPDLISAALPEYESASHESMADIVNFGKNVFARVERSTHALLCGDATADKSQRQELLNALAQAGNLGADRVASEIAKMLLTYLFIVPPINGIAAKIIVERYLDPALADMKQNACGKWAEDLRRRPGGAPGQQASAPAKTEAAAAASFEKTAKKAGPPSTLISQNTQVDAPGPRNIFAVVDKIKSAAQARPVDLAALTTYWTPFYETLTDPALDVNASIVLQVMGHLKDARAFGLLAKTADRMLLQQPEDAKVRCLYGQALIDSGRLQAGIDMLAPIAGPDGNPEAIGLTGRANKQVYTDHVASPSAPLFLREKYRPYLKRAIENYGRVFDPDNVGATHWHGVNLVALLKLAEDDGHAELTTVRGLGMREIAEKIRAALEPMVEQTSDSWVLASLAEAYLGLGEYDKAANAAKYLSLFVNHRGPDGKLTITAFKLAGALRQLEQVWRLKPEDEKGGQILAVVKAAEIATSDTRFTLPGDSLDELSKAAKTATKEAYSSDFERTTKDGKYVGLRLLFEVVERAKGVAAVADAIGDTQGTGFVIRGSDLHPQLGNDLYLLTNAHVMGDRSWPGFHDGSLDPFEARLVLQAAKGTGLGLDFRKTVVWQSPVGEYDATLVRILNPPPDLDPLPIAEPDFMMAVRNDQQQGGTKVSIIGYPKGGPLSLSVVGDVIGGYGVLVDMGGRKAPDGQPAYLHYEAPTEPGNSGSPVFETTTWKVIGLHHAGFPDAGRERLCGVAAFHAANEGICLRSIQKRIAEDIKNNLVRL